MGLSVFKIHGTPKKHTGLIRFEKVIVLLQLYKFQKEKNELLPLVFDAKLITKRYHLALQPFDM